MDSTGAQVDWFAVRCIFEISANSTSRTYEERVTLWKAASAAEALARAESEAEGYAAGVEGNAYLGLAQSYHLFDEPGEGAEVFSLMRDSELGPSEYISRFFSVGTEHQSVAE